jgi:DNA modification methylase
MKNQLFYGDNLEILRTKVRDESVDLCYIDPPFNSKRTYNQIYTNIGQEDLAQAQAFVDTWVWDDKAKEGYSQIISNHEGRFTAQTIDLITGLRNVLKEGSLLAYLVSMTLRIVEIQRVLKPTGSFYLHCDPTSSHYLKLVLDGVFCSQGGEFQNELIWNYSGWNAKLKESFNARHDVIFLYAKLPKQKFNSYCLPWESEAQYLKLRKQKLRLDRDGRKFVLSDAGNGKRVKRYLEEAMAYGQPVDDVWAIDKLNNSSKERLGYPTQKPEALLERIIKAGSNEGDVVLDCYCGCGTTVAVAQRSNRRWIGMDITYQSISLVLKRLERDFGAAVAQAVVLDGTPRDMESAVALAHKKDDRSRKEFEKWAILTYTNNRGIINEKKGGDRGIDGVAYILSGESQAEKMLLQVKSGGVGRGDIAKLRGDMDREAARMGTLITLEEPTKGMVTEAKTAGMFTHSLTGNNVDKIRIVTIQQMVEGKISLELPVSLDALWKAKESAKSNQLAFSFVPANEKTPRKPAQSEVEQARVWRARSSLWLRGAFAARRISPRSRAVRHPSFPPTR